MIDINAEIYTTSNQFLYVKLCLDNGVYISGIKVSASTKYPDQVWIQMPAYKAGKGWKRYIEIAGECELGKEIYRVIEDLTKPRLFPGGVVPEPNNTSPKDIVITDFDENEPINLDDIPF